MRDKKSDVKKEKIRGEWLCRKLDIPCDILPCGSLITVRGRGEVAIEGCRRILEYKKEAVKIAVLGGAVLVEGRDLECIFCVEGRIGIEGRIDKIGFSEEAEGKKE